MISRLALLLFVGWYTPVVLAQPLLLRNLILDERKEVLLLAGTFGETEGVVYVNHTARALTGEGWSNNAIEVPLHPQDEGEVYVQVGDQTSNARWITAWDFTVTRHQASRLPSVCSDCFWHMTWRFRLRGDILPVDYGGGVVTAGGPQAPACAARRSVSTTSRVCTRSAAAPSRSPNEKRRRSISPTRRRR